MTPYQVFAEAVKEGPLTSFQQAWRDFCCWEAARDFCDDPNAAARDAVVWMRQLDELAEALEQFAGPGKESCQHALEAAAVAFARLDHDPQLCEAVRRWHERRRQEAAERVNANPQPNG